MALTHKQAGGITGAVWLFGLAALFYTNAWWPGIMIVIGLSALIEGLAYGRGWAAVQGAVWCLGIAAWVYFNYSLVALFVILGCSALLSAFWPPPFMQKKPKPQSDPYLE
jgi:hypothetical protein